MTPNQFDQAVELQLDLFRSASTIERDVLRLLLQMEKDLVAEVAGSKYTEWGKQRVSKQLAEVRALIKSQYDKAASVALEGTSAIAEVSARATVLSLGAEAVLPSAAMLEAIAGKSVIQGAAQGAWWARQSEDTAFRFSQAVRQGLVNAETNQQIIRRVRGFLDTSKANAAALVQTSVATVANDGRDIVFARNDDIIKKYRAVATLDTHTCERCAPLDGLEWDKDGKGIGHSMPKPTYPLHFNCRCLFIPVVLDGPQGGMRASSDGPVSAKLTFDGWLERQSKEKQEQVLGKGRADLYRKGKITLADLTRGNGRPLTLDELRKKYA
jgi:SPP1 gp7 family putative phage head morphogenesis protein